MPFRNKSTAISDNQGVKVEGTKLSAAQRIEQALLEEISMGVLSPGQRLDETGLARRFEASRTPAREALSRLTAQGILVQGEKRGVFVAEYSREELGQIFETMHEIEAACARIAAQRLTFLARSEIETAQAACLEAAESGDRAAYAKANEAFHQAIYRATGNRYMAELASDFRRRTGPFRAKKLSSPEDLKASALGHVELMNDIFSEDSLAASKSMRRHSTTGVMQVLKAN